MARVVERLPSKHETLSSKPVPPKGVENSTCFRGVVIRSQQMIICKSAENTA
jgi:hypothetical protein